MLRSSAHVCVIVVSRVEVRQLCMSPIGNVINFFTRVLCGDCLALGLSFSIEASGSTDQIFRYISKCSIFYFWPYG